MTIIKRRRHVITNIKQTYLAISTYNTFCNIGAIDFFSFWTSQTLIHCGVFYVLQSRIFQVSTDSTILTFDCCKIEDERWRKNIWSEYLYIYTVCYRAVWFTESFWMYRVWEWEKNLLRFKWAIVWIFPAEQMVQFKLSKAAWSFKYRPLGQMSQLVLPFGLDSPSVQLWHPVLMLSSFNSVPYLPAVHGEHELASEKVTNGLDMKEPAGQQP